MQADVVAANFFMVTMVTRIADGTGTLLDVGIT